MAKGRMVARSIAYDPAFNSLSLPAQLLFLRAIPHLDRDGLITGEPLVLWGAVAPRCKELQAVTTEAIEAWQAAGLVELYECDMGPVLWFTGFSRNQVGMVYSREGASIYPPPPGYVRGTGGLEPEQPVKPAKPADSSSVYEQATESITGGDTPQEKPEPLACKFQHILDDLRESKNKIGKLGELYQLCYGEEPDYSRLGKLAKQVGGAGRLAQLLWQYSAARPAGNVLDYITRTHNAQARRNGGLNGNNGTNGTEHHEQPTPDSEFLERFRAAQTTN